MRATVEAFTILSYQFSQFVLPSSPEDDINSSIFLMAIHLVKAEKLALGPIYLESLYTRLDKCINNILYCVGRCDNTCFMQIFLWVRFGGSHPSPQNFLQWR